MRPIFAAAWLLVASQLAASLPAQDRPNVLFLFADDMRADALGVAGNPDARTPRIDALCRSGCRFTNAYCMGSRHGAVCMPSRAMVMSGRRLTAVKDDLEGVTTLPQRLAASGYATFMTGKWHNGEAALTRSFPDARAVMIGGMSDHNDVPLADVVGGNVENRRRGEGHSSEMFADAAIGFLRAHQARAGEAPFFTYVAFTAPHDPRDAPESYRARFAEKKAKLPPNFRPQHGWNFAPGALTTRDEKLAAWPRDPAVVAEQLGEYHALITHLDDQIGRILDTLQELELADDTLIVFAADHGLAMGSHGLLGKQSLYDHSMHAPLALVGPGVTAREERAGLVYLHDIFPTLCEVAGVEIPDDVHGRSLWPAVHDADSPCRDHLFTLYANNQRAVRTARYKLIRWPRIAKSLLFDLQQDPQELHDLADSPEHAATLARMTLVLEAAQAAANDPLPLTADELLPEKIDLAGRERKPDRWQPKWIVEKYFR